MATYKNAVGIRGDCLFCPLPLSIDSYWNCKTDCWHCPFRRLNRTWGTDLRPADPEDVARKLENGLKNKNPKTSMAWALKLKKTIRLGSKTDPFQDAEMRHRVTKEILKTLIRLNWSFVIQTRFLHNAIEYEDLLEKAHKRGLLTLLPIISPGLEEDIKIFERNRTTPLHERAIIIKRALGRGWSVGVNGEPFIPGYHTPREFSNALDFLKGLGIRSYNTYNLHLNDDVAKKLHGIGLNILKIWEMNQDGKWERIHKKLCRIAAEKKMILGCPDFVNTGWGWRERANTCCGVTVPNPSRFNSHHWKHLLQKGKTPREAFELTWEGIGDRKQGVNILKGRPCSLYTMGDVTE